MNKWFKDYWCKDYKFLATSFTILAVCTIIRAIVKLLVVFGLISL